MWVALWINSFFIFRKSAPEQRKRERTKEQNQANPSNECQSNTALKRGQEFCSQKSKLLRELRVSDLLKQIMWSLLTVKQKGPPGGGQVGLTNFSSENFSQKGRTPPLVVRTLDYRKENRIFRKRKQLRLFCLKTVEGDLMQMPFTPMARIHLHNYSTEFQNVKTQM